MSLRLIYGRTGTGKSTNIFNEIKENIDNKSKKYIITPEQFSYSAERNLLSILETKSVIKAEVLTFNRMAERVASEVGGKTETSLTKAGKAMLIYSILEKQKDSLKFLENSENNVELSMQSIKEFKKHGITEETLQKTIQNIENPLLKTKLIDINSIYSNYEEYIKERFIDDEDILTKLATRLENSKMFINTEIYIDEFSGFTKQEYDIIEKLLKKAKRVTISLSMDNLEIGNKETDIFYSNKMSANKLIEIAKDIKVEIEKPIYLEKNYKLKSQELLHLEQNIYSSLPRKYVGNIENINLFLATNPYSEMEQVAKSIIRLVRDEGLKYNEIAIITKNIDAISGMAKMILEKNEIPVFVDTKEDLAKNPVVKYLLSILEIFSKNWSQEAVISYIKSGFLNLNEEEIYKLENYAIKWGIKGSKWYKEDWVYDEENPNELRKKIVIPLLNFKKSLEDGKTAVSLSKILYEFLEKNGIFKKAQESINKYQENGAIHIAKNYKQSIDVMIDVMDEIVKIYSDTKMTFKKYKEILKVGLSYKEIGNIPEVLDQVMLGDVDRTRSHKIKVAFILGVNDGIFPSINKSEGFINDEEREILKKLGSEIAKGSLDLLYEDQFNIYKALTTAEKKMYISYTSTDKDGKSLRPSMLISKIKRIFPKLQEETDVVKTKSEISSQEATFEELLKNLYEYKNGDKIDRKWFEIYNWYKSNKDWSLKLEKALLGLQYTNAPEPISQNNIENLYGQKLKTSVSKLEKYKKCPFSFYLEYGLKLKEKKEFKIQPIDTGSFMHEIIEEFFKNIVDLDSLQEEDIIRITEKIIESKLKLKKNYLFSSSKKFITLTNRLKKTVIQSIEYIVYQMKNSDFNVLSNELEFTKTIDNLEIVGKIDRVDLSKSGGYIRIIDYKSSNKDINLNEMLAGTQIQLLTYMDVISEQQQKKPAGVFYFNLIEPIIKDGGNLTTEQIKDKIKNAFKMKGLILADIKVIKMMDKKIEKGTSDIVPVYLSKDGEISQSRSSAITEKDFEKLQNTVRNLISKIANEILSGNIDIKPVYNRKTKTSACEYCKYRTICRFDKNINNYEYIENKEKEEILNKI